MTDKAYIVDEEEANIEKLGETINKIHESNTKLKDYTLSYYSKKIDDHLKEIKKYSKRYKRKTISIILTIAASIGISTGICKQTSTLNYNGIEYIYDGNDVKKNREFINSKAENYAIITEYGEWNEDGTQRINKIYDVSEYTFEDIKEYMNIDLSNIECEESIEYFSNLNNIREINEENTKEVLIHKYDLSHPTKDYFNMIYLLAAQIIVTFVLSATLGIIKDEKVDNRYLDLSGFYVIFYLFNNKSEKMLKARSKEKLKMYLENNKKILNEILGEIEKNEELRNNFVRLFNENVYLLNDPNLLLEKYNETLKEYDLLTDKKYVDETVPELKRILNEGGNNAR